MTEFMKTYKLKIIVLSPVHIGASADLEPTEYVICGENDKPASDVIVCPECGYKNPLNKIGRDRRCLGCDSDLPVEDAPAKKSGIFLYTFTPGQLSAALSDADKQSLLKAAKDGDPMTVQSFFKNKAAAIVKTATKRATVCPEVARKYEEKFGRVNGKNNEFNRFIIEKQISDPATGLPYIPGSSIKGAIRTALMSAKNKATPLNRQNYIQNNKPVKNAGSLVEKKLYGYETVPAQDAPDPFKALKLSDATAENKEMLTKICPMRRTGGKSDIPANIEVIPEKETFISSLSILQKTEPVNFGETIETIRTACNKFYLDVLKKEIDRKWDENIDGLIKCLEEKAADPNVFLLCLGKNSGAESKTIDDLRIIENRKKHTLMEHSETYWELIDDNDKIKPFGWCVVEFEEEK